mmetsp:Transcript_16284/g.39063  ORF Transcript_16284/g.39063 Transcript_16284/m.39063 type:complete len:205 (-) Transcript_16284:243-857(-)
MSPLVWTRIGARRSASTPLPSSAAMSSKGLLRPVAALRELLFRARLFVHFSSSKKHSRATWTSPPAAARSSVSACSSTPIPITPRSSASFQDSSLASLPASCDTAGSCASACAPLSGCTDSKLPPAAPYPAAPSGIVAEEFDSARFAGSSSFEAPTSSLVVSAREASLSALSGEAAVESVSSNPSSSSCFPCLSSVPTSSSCFS